MGLVSDVKFGVWVPKTKIRDKESKSSTHRSGDCHYETAYSFIGISLAQFLRSTEAASDLHEHEAIFLEYYVRISLRRLQKKRDHKFALAPICMPQI